ncbi:MAG: hypothetical protein ACREJ3_17965 [Polyangiaceae bacterium]
MRSSSVPLAVLAAAAVVVTLSGTKDAHALGPVDVEVGAKVGGATSPVSSSNGASSENPLGFGLGARGGISALGFYGGVSLMYYLGSSQDVSVLGQSASVSEHTLMYGIEGGYGLNIDRFGGSQG